MRKILAGVIVLFVSICGCATNPVIKQTSHQLEKKDYKSAFSTAESLILSGSKEDSEKCIELFKKDHPQAVKHIYSYYFEVINNTKTAADFIFIPGKLQAMQKHALLTQNEYSRLLGQLNKVADIKNKNNGLEFDLTDNIDGISVLQNEDNQLIIFKRSVDELSDKGSYALEPKVFNYVKNKGKQSVEYNYLKSKLETMGSPDDFSGSLYIELYPKLGFDKYLDALTKKPSDRIAIEVIKIVKDKGAESYEYKELKKHLPQMKLSLGVMKQHYKDVFPEIIDPRIEKCIIKLKIDAKPPNDSSIFDIEERLAAKDQISIVEKEQADVYILRIRKVRFVERNNPDRVNTISYQQYQCNIVGAALLMPRNATYLYDVHSGGFEIKYSFRIRLIKNGKEIAKEKIKGESGADYKYCTNARIRNVFGGVSPASFVANDHMSSICSLNTQSVDTERIYDSVIDDVTEKILSLKPIKDKIEPGL